MKIDLSQVKRYEKQIILKRIGIVGQKKIVSSKVLIIGAGGLGSPLAIYLAASGVGTIGIVDHDKVEISNLSRQTLFKSKDVGKYKVKSADNLLRSINNSKSQDLWRHIHGIGIPNVGKQAAKDLETS